MVASKFFPGDIIRVMNDIGPSRLPLGHEFRVTHIRNADDFVGQFMSYVPLVAVRSGNAHLWLSFLCVNAVRLVYRPDYVSELIEVYAFREYPLQHLVLFLDLPCPMTLLGDVTFMVGKTITEGEKGTSFTTCPLCYDPKWREI